MRGGASELRNSNRPAVRIAQQPNSVAVCTVSLDEWRHDHSVRRLDGRTENVRHA
jgi:hypothetical protein